MAEQRRVRIRRVGEHRHVAQPVPPELVLGIARRPGVAVRGRGEKAELGRGRVGHDELPAVGVTGDEVPVVHALLDQLDIERGPDTRPIRVLAGGPVEEGRGFVLHSDDYVREDTLKVEHGFALTATIEILKALAKGEGPQRSLLALGYSGWGPGQLEREISDNGWLNVPADPGLVFDEALDTKWERALAKLRLTPSSLSGVAGHA